MTEKTIYEDCSICNINIALPNFMNNGNNSMCP